MQEYLLADVVENVVRQVEVFQVLRSDKDLGEVKVRTAVFLFVVVFVFVFCVIWCDGSKRARAKLLHSPSSSVANSC